MAKLQILKGSTSVSIYVFIQDSSSQIGSGLTGLVFNSGSLVCYYVRPLGSATQLSLVTQTVTGAWTSGGFVEISSTNMPGVYRLDIADAAIASGVNSVVLVLRGAANMVPCHVELELVAVNPQDSVRYGLTALPNAAAEASGGLFTRGSGAGQLNQNANGQLDSRTVAMLADVVTASAIAAGAIGSSEAPLLANLDATVSSRAAPGAAMDLVDNAVDAGAVATDGADEIRTGLATSAALATAQTDLTTLTGRLTSARAGFLDNLNVGGNVASSAEVTSVQNNTRVVRVVPDVFERPDSGSTVFRIEILLYDSVGNMEAPDSTPTISVVNQGGTNRDANLDSTTMSLVSAGRYRSTYTIDTNHVLEQLLFSFSVVEGGATRLYGNTGQVVDTTAVDFTSADRTMLQTLHDVRLTSGRAANLDNLNATVSSRAVAGDAMALTSGERTTLTGIVYDEVLPGAHAANSAGERLATLDDRIDVILSSRAAPGAAMTLTSGERTAIDTELSGTHGSGAWGGGGSSLTQQDVRDAMKLAPTAGSPILGSVDEELDSILVGVSAIDGRLPADPADDSDIDAGIAAAVAAIPAGVQTGMTAQGYTTARAPNLDAPISTRAAPGAAMALTSGERTTMSQTVRDTTLTGSSAGSIGFMLQLLGAMAGLANVRIDNMVYDGNGFLESVRLRAFLSAGAAAASTEGGSGEGEFLTRTLTGLPDSVQLQLPSSIVGVIA